MRLRVAVIDDEVSVRRLYSETLRGAGHHVEEFEHPQGWASATNSDYHDVVFLDNHFDQKPNAAVWGAEFLPVLRKRAPEAYVVMMSAREFKPDMVQIVLENRVDAFLTNPAAHDEILECIRRAVLVKERELRAASRMIEELSRSGESPGFLKHLGELLRGSQRKRSKATLEYVQLTEECYLLQPMEKLFEVSRGDTIERTIERGVVRSESSEIATRFGVSSELEVDTLVKAGLKSTVEAMVTEEASFATEVKISESITFSVHDVDARSGTYTKERYLGLLYRKHVLEGAINCGSCGIRDSSLISLLVPEKWVVADVHLNERGETIRDGRNIFVIWGRTLDGSRGI